MVWSGILTFIAIAAKMCDKCKGGDKDETIIHPSSGQNGNVQNDRNVPSYAILNDQA